MVKTTICAVVIGVLLGGCADRSAQYSVAEPSVVATRARPPANAPIAAVRPAPLSRPSAAEVSARVQSQRVRALEPAPATPPTSQYGENLRLCLSGSSGCQFELLTEDDRAKADASGYQGNLTTCMRGQKFDCRHAQLRPDDLVRVREVEYQLNLTTCLRGRSRGCRHADLRSDDLVQVQEAEYRDNLTTCLRGQSSGCRHAGLRQDDLGRVLEAEYRVNLARCMRGQGHGCRHAGLRSEDLKAVLTAEYKFNLERCLSRYPSGCNRALLSPEDLQRATNPAEPITTGSTVPTAPIQTD
jgi:hypothetical protein